MSELTRRRFCLVGGALALGACRGGGSTMADAGVDMAAPFDLARPMLDMVNPQCAINGHVVAGPATSFAVGDVKLLDCSGLFVIRDAGGIYAMTGICTHQGCFVNYVPANHDFECPCHQSTFDINGAVTMSPATMPLPHYACSLDSSGNVIIDVTTTVDPATRLAV